MTLRTALLAGLLILVHTFKVSASSAKSSAPATEVKQQIPVVEVMILGTYHMANPGRDVANVQVDDMLQPKRQRELEQLTLQLERFHPTKVAVEEAGTPPGYVFDAALNPSDLKARVSETYQLGERIALGAGLDRIFGVNSPPNLDFDAVQKLDQRITGGKRMDALTAEAQRFAADAEAQQHAGTVGQSLAWMNTAAAIGRNHDLYMKTLTIQDGDDQPAARLDAAWFERNLRIWGKIMQIARPGDRIVVIYGQGHAFWLRTLAQQTPGYALIDPLPYLETPSPRSR